MADIKTRDVVKGTIKKIDKAAIAADRMRAAYVQTKEKAEHTSMCFPDLQFGLLVLWRRLRNHLSAGFLSNFHSL